MCISLPHEKEIDLSEAARGYKKYVLCDWIHLYFTKVMLSGNTPSVSDTRVSVEDRFVKESIPLNQNK